MFHSDEINDVKQSMFAICNDSMDKLGLILCGRIFSNATWFSFCPIMETQNLMLHLFMANVYSPTSVKKKPFGI